MIQRLHVEDRDGARRAAVTATPTLAFFSGLQAESTEGDARAQTASALGRLDQLLAAIGETQASLLFVQIWLKDMRYFGAMNAEWNAWADPESPPARTCVSGELSRPDALVEVIAVAARDGSRT